MGGIGSLNGSKWPWSWNCSGTYDMGNLLGQLPFLTDPLHFLRVTLPSKGVLCCREGRLPPWFGCSHLWGSGPRWFPSVSCYNGERRHHYPQQCLCMNRGSYEFFVLYRNNNKINLRHDHWQHLQTFRGSRNWPILFQEGGEGNKLQWSQLLCSPEKMFLCNDLSRE